MEKLEESWLKDKHASLSTPDVSQSWAEKSALYLQKGIAVADESQTWRKGASLRLMLARLLSLQMKMENASLPSTLLLLEERNMLLDWIIDCTARQVSDELKEQARQLKQHSTPLTAEEKREIHEALVAGNYFGSNGHWYECPNGHRYFIGECGGAMEQGICNECGEVIGGGSHRLLPTNRAVANDL